MKIKKSILKSDNIVKSPKNKNLKFAIIAGLATLSMTAPVVGVINEYQVFDPDIVNKSDITKIANTLNADTTYLGSEYRFIPPENKPIYFNVDIDGLNDMQKGAIYEAVNLLNMVCHEINPNYKFEVRFNPTKRELKDNYVVNIVKDDIDGNVTGTSEIDKYFFTTAGKGTYRSTIVLDNSLFGSFDDYYRLRNTTLHEAMHSIARLDDAYKVEEYSIPSIMQSANSSEIPFTLNDIKILISKLSETSTPIVNAEELYNKTLPIDEMKEKIEYVKSTINADYLNYCFNLTGKDAITDEVEFDNIGEMYAINQWNKLASNNNINGSLVFKNTKVVGLYNLKDDQFDYGRFDYSLTGNTYLNSTFKNINVDGTTYLDYNQIAGKWGDKLIIAQVEKADTESGWDMVVSEADIVSEEEYNKVLLRIKNHAGSDYFNEQIYSTIIEKYNPIGITNIPKEGLTLQSSRGYYILKDNTALKSEDKTLYYSINKNGIILNSDDTAIFKDEKGNYRILYYNYDFVDNSLFVNAYTTLKDLTNSNNMEM